MRSATLLIGAVLLATSVYFLSEGGSIKTREEVMNVGGLHMTAERSHPVLPWMAWIGIVAGGALMVAGLTRKM